MWLFRIHLPYGKNRFASWEHYCELGNVKTFIKKIEKKTNKDILYNDKNMDTLSRVTVRKAPSAQNHKLHVQ